MSIRRYQPRGRRVPIPTVTTSKSQPQELSFEGALHTGRPNDNQPNKTLRYITDMRFDGIGKFKTRKGCDHYTVAIGETVNAQVTSTTGASDAAFSKTTWIAEKLTAASSGVATRVDVRVKNSAGATGTALVCIYDDNAGEPGELISTSSIPQDSVATSYGYITTYSMQAPTVTNAGHYWIVLRLQDSANGSMYASTTTNSTNAKVSTDAGQTWTASAYSLNVKMYTATAGGVRGVTRVYRPNGEGFTFFAHGTTLYKVSDSDGSTTSIDATLPAGDGRIRFDYVNDTLYYTDNIGKPRKYNWTASSVVTACPKNVTNLMNHVGLMFYFHLEDPTSFFFSNFGQYEVFTSTDFLYADAPKKSDHLTAMAKLNGVLYLFTRANKYMLLGQDNATFRVDEAYDQKGTFSQESVVFDDDFIYFASDDGVYKFNGTTAKNIIEDILPDYTNLQYKEDIHLQLNNNRLYIWYRPNGDAETNECIVYNTLQGVVESIDTNTYIGRTFALNSSSNMFIQASNRAGVLYFGERHENNYHNLGAPLQAEVRTAYDHFGTPQQQKRIPYWRPIIETTQGNYTAEAGFAADMSDDVNYIATQLQGSGYTYDDAGSLYDSATYASTGFKTDTTLGIYGFANRWQRRYKHHAAYEPFVFAGEVLTVETQRLR